MANSSSPLTGAVLVDCAKANAEQGVETAAQRCGYGGDVAAFENALRSACADMDIDLQSFSDLSVDQELKRARGVEVAPDTAGNL
jgi:hypothetical protein